MTTLTEERPVTTTGTDHDVTHLVCCDENLARCGKDVTEDSWRNGRPDDECCPLCLVLRGAAWDEGRCCPIGKVTW